MCGIFSIINSDSYEFDDQLITTSFLNGKTRGPEFSSIKYYKKYNSIIGFHRLAINGLNDISNQPITIGEISLICNGEIYNYKKLYEIMNIEPTTQSDCEIIIHLFNRYGIDETLRIIDGVFSFVLYTPTNIYISRDPFGVRPLYFIEDLNNCYLVASEMKSLIPIAKKYNLKINHFKPSTYTTIKIFKNKLINDVNIDVINTNYNIININSRTFLYNMNEYERKLDEIYDLLKLAVFKRCETTERPIACLLSGGLDSSLIAALVSLYMKEHNLPPVETYSIGLPESVDIKFARLVAEHIGSKHTEIIVSENEMISAIPDVIHAIESYDVTTIRASIGNYLIGKYIKENSLAKVIFNGDGSDELCGGYIYMNKCPDDIEFDKETMKLLKDIYMFDVLRSDKCISSHGLEPRTPFLDKYFVNCYLSIPIQHRRHQSIEKFMLREAFSGKDLLPEEIIWRKKEAFSDGVSTHGRSLFQIIQEYVIKWCGFNNIVTKNFSNIELEKMSYLDYFNNYYPNQEQILPYYWMPKYTNSDDPSARTLEHYKNE